MSNPIHHIVEHVHESNPELYLENPYEELQVGDFMDASSPSTIGCGIIVSIKDTEKNRIFEIDGGGEENHRIFWKHEDHSQWLVKVPQNRELTDS